MGSVSSVNPGVNDLLQSLTSLKSPVLSSPTVVSALESAPTADVVQLSAAANQLSNIDAMFGISTSATDDMGSTLLAELQNPSGASTSVLSTASGADKAANAEAAIQSQLAEGLFGTGSGFPGSIFTSIG